MFDPIEEQVVAARGSATLSAQAVATTVLGFGFFVILVRLLGPFALGLYVAIGILTALGSALGGFGLPAAAVRFAAFLGFGGGEAAFRRTLLLLALCAAFITGIILYFLAPWTSAILAHSGAFTDLFRLAALLVTASILAGILDGWTRGQREFVRLAISRVVCRILSVGLGAYLLLTGWGVLGAIWSLITYHGFLIALLVPPFARGLLGREFYPLRGVVTFSLPLMASSAAVFGSGYAESLLIVAFLATPDLGVYNVALTVGTFLAIIMVGPLTTTVLPTSSRVAFLGRSQGGVFAVASRYVTLLVLPSSVGVVVLARQWVALVAGTDFAAATEPAALVGVMILPVALISILSALLMAEGRTARVLLLTVLPIPLAIVLGLILVPRYGLIGAALSRDLLYCGGLLAAWASARGIIPLAYDWNLLGRVTVASAAFGIPLYILQLWNTSLLLLPFYVLLGVVIYLFMLRAMEAVNGDDRHLARQLLPRGLSWLVRLL